MELLVGPAFTIEVPSSPPHSPAACDGAALTSSEAPKSFLEEGSVFQVGGEPGFFAGESSESSSSIGTPDDSDDENDGASSKKEEGEVEQEEEEVQSKLKGLGSLDSLEESLPIKRGLSNHFAGKSKSFTDLSQVSQANSVNELQKQENPFNKKRKVLIASKRSRRSSFYTWSNPQSMPLLPVDEDSDEPEEEEEDQKARKVSPPSSSSSSSVEKKPQDELHLRQQNRVPLSYAAHMRQRLGSFKSRSFSLADLQEHDGEEEEGYYD